MTKRLQFDVSTNRLSNTALQQAQARFPWLGGLAVRPDAVAIAEVADNAPSTALADLTEFVNQAGETRRVAEEARHSKLRGKNADQLSQPELIALVRVIADRLGIVDDTGKINL